MNASSMKTGLGIAAAAAALFATTATLTTASAADAPTVKCAGANSCKGQGWVSKKDEKECKAAGGTVSK